VKDELTGKSWKNCSTTNFRDTFGFLTPRLAVGMRRNGKTKNEISVFLSET
jgi:hypothetical protein